jgi:integrase
MTEAHSTPSNKPAKPSPDFPLFAHAAGVWAKKIRGKLHYFGPWSDPEGALKKYLAEKDDLHAGRTPRPDAGDLKVKDLANAFLDDKQTLLDAGEIAQRTWDDYKEICDLVVAHFGKGRLVADLGADDFTRLRAEMAKRWGPVRLGVSVQKVRSLFKHGFDAGLMDRPVRFGPTFRRPAKKVLRLHRTGKGPRMFEPAELRRALDAAGQPLRAMLLLGVNCGFGNADCGRLPLSALDLEGGWVHFPRPKTGVARRCPLWPETVEALREWLAGRKGPADPANAGLVFHTQRGHVWHKRIANNPIARATRRLLDRLGINGHRNFYALRHTFETVGGESRDQAAVDHIMGHARDDMASVYRERISDERLRAVTDHVRGWLFGEPAAAGRPTAAG